jgi:hypothetical protein
MKGSQNMKRINYKNLLILILMIGASIGIAKDFIQIMLGATYTWFGLATGFINVMIVGLGLDKLRG